MRSWSREGWEGAVRENYGGHEVDRGGRGRGGIIVRFSINPNFTPVALATSSCHVSSYTGPNVNLTLYGSWGGD